MAETLLGIVTAVREAQLANAQAPRVVTLSGIITEISESHDSKAEFAIATVGYPPKMNGIVIDPSEPVYPVIVAFPPLTVYV